tara:strand:- start:1261 stop:1569 length:309 start_codon:yes stop_codon:yes gene_type:complete
MEKQYLRSYSQKMVDWLYKGYNPIEETMSWGDLLKDDLRKLTRTDKSFEEGAEGIKGWRPLKAFTPKMIKTGTTPAVRRVAKTLFNGVKAISPSLKRLEGYV